MSVFACFLGSLFMLLRSVCFVACAIVFDWCCLLFV